MFLLNHKTFYIVSRINYMLDMMRTMGHRRLGKFSEYALVLVLVIYVVVSWADGSIFSSPVASIPNSGDVTLSQDSPDEYYNESYSLFYLMPDIGPNETTVTNAITEKPTTSMQSNAVGQAYREFRDNKDQSFVAFIGISKTVREPYWHDYSVCTRYQGGSLENISLIQLPIDGKTAWFWLETSKKSGITEKATSFAVLVDETNSTYDIYSRRLYEKYPLDLIKHGPYDYILNYQIWANSSTDLEAMLKDALDLLQYPQGENKIHFDNIDRPVVPPIFMKSAKYTYDGISLELVSSLNENTTAPIAVKWYDPDNTSQWHIVTYNKTISSGNSIVKLPPADALDATIYLGDPNNPLDKTYVTCGNWDVFNDSDSNVILDRSQCENGRGTNSSDYSFGGCANLTYQINSQGGYVGIYYIFNPSAQPIDVSQYKAITFYAKGNGGRYSVKIQTDSISDRDYFQYVFSVTEKGDQITVRFKDLDQNSILRKILKRLSLPGTSFSAKDVKSVIWQPVDIEYGRQMDIYIGNASFVD